MVSLQVTGKRCDGKETGGACADVYAAGEYEASIHQEKQDGVRSQAKRGATPGNEATQNDLNLKVSIHDTL